MFRDSMTHRLLFSLICPLSKGISGFNPTFSLCLNVLMLDETENDEENVLSTFLLTRN